LQRTPELMWTAKFGSKKLETLLYRVVTSSQHISIYWTVYVWITCVTDRQTDITTVAIDVH